MPARRPAKESFLREPRSRFAFLLVFNRRSVILIASLALFVAVVVAWRIRERAHQRLAEERALLEKQNLIPFEHESYSATTNKAIEVWQSYKSTRALVRFKDSYFVATDGGLVELGPTGSLLRHYTVLDGLPESDLLSLATFNSKLFIGTRTQGLVVFDGERFAGYRWTDRVPQSINALFEDGGRLLIGTRAGGLIEFDGRQFKEIKVGPDHKRLLEINLVSRNGARLFVGTFADGLWIEEGARWFHFTVADGLLSNRIVGVVAGREKLFVACDYGLSVASFADLSTEATQNSPASFRSLAFLPSLSSMIEFGSSVLLSKDNGESFRFQREENLSRQQQVIPVAWNRPDGLSGCHLVACDQDLWMLGDRLRRAHLEASEARGQTSGISFSFWGGINDSAPLNSNLISALSVDGQGRLWAGSFRNGIDVLAPHGERLGHVESELVREINFLGDDQQSKTVLAATSAGLFWFDANLRVTEHWSTSDGLVSNSVLHVARLEADATAEDPRNPIVACATSKGLAQGPRGKLRVLTTVQGLPSNSLYAVVVQGRKTYVGTLGGLALIEDGRVTGVFNDTNSKLTHNWVTALCAIGPRLFVGTYGGGVFELAASKELRGFSSEIGRAVVNPNSMWSDGSRLYVGTLDGALIFDLYSQQWTRLKSELPSRTVLSITGDEKYVYFGTTSGIARVERAFFASPSGQV